MSDVLPAVFPGTFDPPTRGHLDLINRARRLFSPLTIAVAASPGKHPLFPLERRLEAVRACVGDDAAVRVRGFTGMLTDFLRETGARVLIRGVRTASDYAYELQLIGMYRLLLPDLEVILLPAAAETGFISSSLVREVIRHHGDVSPFVPAPCVGLIADARAP